MGKRCLPGCTCGRVVFMCVIDDCDRPVVGRGWCRRHYSRWRRTGDPLGSVPRVRKPHSAATRAKIAAKATGRKHSSETLAKLSEQRRGHWHGVPVVGSYSVKGYCYLSGQYDHPLASANGQLAIHRKVLYDKIGPAPHECHWGSEVLETWKDIQPDHIDGDRANNDPDNLVPSCPACNIKRARVGNPQEWAPGVQGQ